MTQPLASRLLRLLSGPCRNWSMGELKAELKVSKSAIWRALGELEEEGCVTITAEED